MKKNWSKKIYSLCLLVLFCGIAGIHAFELPFGNSNYITFVITNETKSEIGEVVLYTVQEKKDFSKSFGNAKEMYVVTKKYEPIYRERISLEKKGVYELQVKESLLKKLSDINICLIDWDGNCFDKSVSVQGDVLELRFKKSDKSKTLTQSMLK